MIKNTDKSNLVYPLGKVETIAGQKQEGEKERARERGERVRDSVLLEKCFGVSQKADPHKQKHS